MKEFIISIIAVIISIISLVESKITKRKQLQYAKTQNELNKIHIENENLLRESMGTADINARVTTSRNGANICITNDGLGKAKNLNIQTIGKNMWPLWIFHS